MLRTHFHTVCHVLEAIGSGAVAKKCSYPLPCSSFLACCLQSTLEPAAKNVYFEPITLMPKITNMTLRSPDGLQCNECYCGADAEEGSLNGNLCKRTCVHLSTAVTIAPKHGCHGNRVSDTLHKGSSEYTKTNNYLTLQKICT